MKPISTKELELYEKNNTDEDHSGPRMPILEHLNELRMKIIISFCVLFVFTIVGFFISKEAIRLLTQVAPPGTTFLQIKPGEFFFTNVKVAVFFGLSVSSPVIIWQLVSFILPGLKENEKKTILPILVLAPILFCLGALFSYFFLVPSMLNFLLGFSKDIILTSISIESYISFTLMIMAICGCAFLLPIVIFVLANIGIVNSSLLLKGWRYAVLVSVISGAILTPTPDPFNMSIVSGILIGLYFISCGRLKICRK